MANSNTEHAGGVKAPKVKLYNIIVNGKQKEFEGNEISFEQVIELAFGTVSTGPKVSYAVTYKRGEGNKPEGSLVAGEVVKLKEGMIFNASATDKS
jgi:hypothetical protein